MVGGAGYARKLRCSMGLNLSVFHFVFFAPIFLTFILFRLVHMSIGCKARLHTNLPGRRLSTEEAASRRAA